MLTWLRRWWAARAARAAAAAAARAEAAAEDERAGEPDDEAAEAEAPLTDELDLHTFLPKECADVVEEYVRAAQEAGFQTVRIIHGKGRGTLRRTVHAVLDRHPAVRTYRIARASRGSWGATLVELLPSGEDGRRDQEHE
ncbi:MAG TPA: Smr/MutS family protein [Kofleriaceae bacterium]|nr:Smr/MutS family protein [Kofleriaceae bacterium]